MDQTTTITKKETPIYHGVRQRSWGKWVSEIREPRKKSRIWVGSFDNPEMAARAHDVAAIAIKDSSAILNFPDLAHILPKPASKSPKDIQAAALKAATLVITEHSRSSRVELEPEIGSATSFEDIFLDLPDLFIDHRHQNDQIFTTLLQMVSSGPDIGDTELWPEQYFLWNGYS